MTTFRFILLRVTGFSACAVAMLATISRAAGEVPQYDVRFTSCEGQVTDEGYSENCPEAIEYCSCDSGGMDFMSDFTSRFKAMAKSMQEQGVTYGFVPTQFYQGVASGGNEQEFDYGGKVDQFLILDSGKLGLWQGMTMTMHAETRFGEDVNFDAVGFAPVNVAMLYPKSTEDTTAITGLSFAQALNENVQLTAGKFNALDLFYMLYPETGRGINGFMNASMVLPLSAARVVPLSFMGAGAMVLKKKQVEGGILVYDTHNVPTTSGFDDIFDNGANIMGFWRFFTDVDGLPGSHLFGGIWSTGEFAANDPEGFVFVPGQGLVVPKQGGAYTLLYIYEQTLWADCSNKDRNIGLLSQWGLADPQTSPIHWSANVAIQGQGLNRCRPQDSVGVGYFHTGLSSDFENLVAPVVALGDVNGVELYYTAAVAKCFRLTTDLQVIEPADRNNDTAIVVGLRGTIAL